MADCAPAPRLMIVSDLDHTMVDHHDERDISLRRFNSLWQADYNFDSMLVFSTGRSPTLYKELRKAKPLATPHMTIMSVGTEIVYADGMTRDSAWEKQLNQGWNREVVVEEAKKLSQLRFQVDTEQRAHKVSFSCTKVDAPQVIAALSERLKARGLDVKLVYSGGTDLDVLPKGAGKGEALAYLLRKLKGEGRRPGTTLVCGDSGNDAELFGVDGVHGVIVGNAQEELLQWHDKNAKNNPKIFMATERCAAGILQALRHFKIEPNVSPLDAPLLQLPFHIEPGSLAAPAHAIVDTMVVEEQLLRGEIANSDAVFDFLRSNWAIDSEMISSEGVRSCPRDALDGLRSMYGTVQNTSYQWVDRLRTAKLGDNAYVVTFDRWQRAGRDVICRVTTAILRAKVGAPYGVEIFRIHQTLATVAGQAD